MVLSTEAAAMVDLTLGTWEKSGETRPSISRGTTIKTTASASKVRRWPLPGSAAAILAVLNMVAHLLRHILISALSN